MPCDRRMSLPRGVSSLVPRPALVALVLGCAASASCGGGPAVTSTPTAWSPTLPAQARGLRDGTPEEVAASRLALEPANEFVRTHVAAGHVPGAVLLIARHGVVVSQLAAGTKEKGSSEPVTIDTLFDLESTTKAIVAAAALALAEKGRLDLDAPIATYVPAFTGGGKERVTVRDMLDHSSGLPSDVELPPAGDAAAIWQAMMNAPLRSPPRTKVGYSDLGFRIAGRAIEAAAGAPLDRVLAEQVTGPLGMKDTLFNPPASLKPRIASTGYSKSRKRTLRGEVEDDIDFAFGGVAGCDGLFATARDLAIFSQMFLDGGVSATGARVLAPRSVEWAATSQTPWADLATAERGWMNTVGYGPKSVGWELMTRTSYAGTTLSPRAFYKGGIAGTYVLADPASDLVAVYLTNRGMPDDDSDAALASWYADVAPVEVFTKIGAAVGRGGR